MPASKGAERTFGQLRVEVFDTAAELGRASARNTARVIRERVSLQGTARVVIATGNSQLEFVRALRDEPDIPWQAVTIFHMDEYLGMATDVRRALPSSRSRHRSSDRGRGSCARWGAIGLWAKTLRG